MNCELCWYCEDTTSTTILTRVEKLKEKFSNFVVNRFFSIYFSRQIFKLNKPGGRGEGVVVVQLATGCPTEGVVQLQGVRSGACPATACPTEGLVQLQGVPRGPCPATGCSTEGFVQLQGVPLRG